MIEKRADPRVGAQAGVFAVRFQGPITPGGCVSIQAPCSLGALVFSHEGQFVALAHQRPADFTQARPGDCEILHLPGTPQVKIVRRSLAARFKIQIALHFAFRAARGTDDRKPLHVLKAESRSLQFAGDKTPPGLDGKFARQLALVFSQTKVLQLPDGVYNPQLRCEIVKGFIGERAVFNADRA